jgi:hypothetical protein
MYSASFVFASVLFIHAFASPWLETKNIGAQMVSMKHGLEAMAADKELVWQILDLHAQRNPDLRQREAQDIENVVRSLVGGVGSVIDGVIGGLFDILIGNVGNILEVLESLAGNM